MKRRKPSAVKKSRPMSIRIKLMLVFFIVSLIPIFAISSLFLQRSEVIFQEQTIKLLTLAADNAEEHILTFFERQKIRTADWSSDGHIRTETEAIIQANDAERALAFSAYLRDKKLPLDETIILTDIFDLSGRIIASSEEKRIGHMESDVAELERKFGFLSAKDGAFGQAILVSLILQEVAEGHPPTPVFHVSVPIFSLSTNEVIGLMVNHVSGDELNAVISVEQSSEPTFESFEMYLVDDDGLMITPSLFVDDAVLKQKVFTDATRACLEGGLEFSGRYKDYRGVWVYGASMCPEGQPWMLILEVDEKEVLAPLSQMIWTILGVSFVLIVLVILFAFFWGRRLTRRIEALAAITHEISHGNFKVQVSTVGNDEITQLGMSINEMSTDLEKYIEQVKSLDSLEYKFIQIVSHQLRTPLTSIRWHLEMLLGGAMGKLTKEQKEFIRITHNADTEVIKRISDLLTAMDIENGRLVISKEDVSLEGLLTPVIAEHKAGCGIKKEISCKYVPPATQLPKVTIDSGGIRQVFTKLVENAITYTPRKGRISAKLFQKAGWLRFEITDNGIGIPAAEQNKIFTKFYRASNASAMTPDASGLGLFIAKYYVEQHGGKIGFTSSENKGSTFWFELPIK